MQLVLLILLLVVIAAINGKMAKKKTGSSNWWKHAVFYQIYPRSFKDSNNDGKGDLQGILEKLDHLTNSGVNAVWLSPIFKSPQVDQGYDISNHTEIDSDYGTIDDLKKLICRAHKKGIKIILDFVPNHTSDRHQWFIDSVNGIEKYRDYYVWANANVDENGNREPPNNWISVFKNSAWTWNENRQQYYLHQFAAAQPDLNYRNPKVVEAMKCILIFWLDRGVDGFRIDAPPFIFEDEKLRDEPLSRIRGYDKTDYKYLDHIYTKDQQESFNMVYQWRNLTDNYTKVNGGDQRVLMTESYSDTNRTMLYFGTANGSQFGAHFTFNFNLITDLNIKSTAQQIVNSINRWLNNIPKIYISNWVIGNHDQHRAATRFGPENVDGFSMLQLMLPGIAVTYNGEEIGQEDGVVSYEEGQDPSARNPEIFEKFSRDFERTPYQWDNSTNAGFNNGTQPWLPVSQKYLETNLKAQQETDELSHYKIYRALTQIRVNPVLISGDVDIKAVDDYTILVKRSCNGSSLVLVFNKGNREAIVNVENDVARENRIEIKSTDSCRELGSPIEPFILRLDPHEALIVSF